MPKSNKSGTVKLIRCVVCHTLVPKSSVIDLYADPVCRNCDEELGERDQELWEKDMAAEIDRVGGYEK